MAALPRSAHVAGRRRAELLGVELDDGLRQPVGDPGAVGIAQILGDGVDGRRLERFQQPALLHQQQRGEIGGIDHVDLRPAGIGLGQHLGGHVARAAAKVLHLDAVFLLEAGVDGVDDLGVEARVEHDLALGLRLVDVDLAGFGGAGSLRPGVPADQRSASCRRRVP